MTNEYQYHQWWDRLTPIEQQHTAACVEADNVDEDMLVIFSTRGPVGPYGLRWAARERCFLAGPFVDFVESRSASSWT